MKTIEVLLFEEGISEPHRHVAREEDTLEQVLSHLRSLGAVVGEVLIFEGEVEINPKERLGGDDLCRTFHARRHHHEVVVSINGAEYKTHAGENTVKHLRKLGKVPADEVLSEFEHGKFDDLSDDASVKIEGGEIFTSHVKTGSSS